MNKTLDNHPATRTWSSLVDEMMTKLEGNGIPWNARQILKEKFREMARSADLHTSHTQNTKQVANTLMEKIIEAAKPKFSGDTSVILGAKVKIVLHTGEDAGLNGLVGTTCHPFPRGYNTTGMVGVRLFKGQKVPDYVLDNCVNVDANKVSFIE